jgi:hypothetical protein
MNHKHLNDMQIKFRFLFILLIASSFMACSDNELITGDNTPSYNQTYLRFVSPAGTNVLDSLRIMSPEKWVMELGTDIMSVSGIRTSDNHALDLMTELFYGSKRAGDEFEGEGPLVHVMWYDSNIGNIEKRPRKYHETYTVTMTSPRVFGDGVSHTLTWYVNVSGRTVDAYKCEVDGHEVSLVNDPFYIRDMYEGRHFVSAIVTVPCK